MKVVLTKEQAEAIELGIKVYVGGKPKFIEMHITDGIWSGAQESLNGMPVDTLIRALYVGYEIEPSPEEKIQKYFKELQDSSFVSKQEAEGVLRTLAILNIKINGVNC